MNVECSVIQSRLAIEMDGIRAVYIKGMYGTDKFFVKNKDFYGNENLTKVEKEEAVKAIEKYNSRHPLHICLVDE